MATLLQTKEQELLSAWNAYKAQHGGGTDNANRFIAQFNASKRTNWQWRDLYKMVYGHYPNRGSGSSSSGGGGTSDIDKRLGPDLANQFAHATKQIDFDYHIAKSQLDQEGTLTRRERQRALDALGFERNQKLRALTERYQVMLQRQPEQFAARGLLRSGLLLTRLGELEKERNQQGRDMTEAHGFNVGQVESRFTDQMETLRERLINLQRERDFGKQELGYSKAAKAAQIAADLRTLGV